MGAPNAERTLFTGVCSRYSGKALKVRTSTSSRTQNLAIAPPHPRTRADAQPSCVPPKRPQPPTRRPISSRGICRSHMPRDLGSVFTLDHRDVVLALQIKPELCELPKITAKPHRCICG